MIHVNRSDVVAPESLGRGPDTPASKELRAARAFISDESTAARQSRFRFSVYRSDEVKRSLLLLFHAKCAFCESVLSSGRDAGVMHFRPAEGIVDEPDHPGYWWLGMRWKNVFLACSACRRGSGGGIAKGRRFPLEKGSPRATKASEERFELPLLLNACDDEPSEHLHFTADGTVVGISDRGRATIFEFGLNRADLRERRIRAWRTTARILEEIELLAESGQTELAAARRLLSGSLESLEQSSSRAAEFSAVARQQISSTRKALDALGVSPSSWGKGWHASMHASSSSEVQRARQLETDFEKRTSKYSLGSKRGREKYKLRRRLLLSIEVKNLRGIRDLAIRTSEQTDSVTPWLTFLGENGVGKSTILQATAIALGGPDSLRNLLDAKAFDPTAFVRHRCKFGEVSLQIGSFAGKHRVRFSQEGVEFFGPHGEHAVVRHSSRGATVTGDRYQTPTVLLAYGATRLVPRPGMKASYGNSFSRINNLFDPFAALVDPLESLLLLERSDFDHAASVIKAILDLPDGSALIKKNNKEVVVRMNGSDQPLDRLSDGYQGVIGLVVDMLRALLKSWPTIGDAEGVVIVDEIGTHLHPAWKMRIVRGLKNALPGLQFLTSTHDPLCLRGLGHGEVVVLQRDENDEIVALADLPSPAEFRVDQLLTSEFFGLRSAVDPDTDDLFKSYYELLALKGKSAAQKEEMGVIKRQLDEMQQLGDTPRDRLMYEVIDKLLATAPASDRATRANVSKEAVRRIAGLWGRVAQ